MFSAETISKLTEDLRGFQAELDDAEKAAAKARAQCAEWSRLIELAQDVQLAPAGELVGDRERGPADWCLCGHPQLLGMVHSLTRCYEGEQVLTPALPQTGDSVFPGGMRLGLPTGPVPAPNMGAWFGPGRPPYTEQGATT